MIELPDGQLSLLPARIIHIPRALWYAKAGRMQVLLSGRPDMRGPGTKELYRGSRSGTYIVARRMPNGDLSVRVHGELTGSEERELDALRKAFRARIPPHPRKVERGCKSQKQR